MSDLNRTDKPFSQEAEETFDSTRDKVADKLHEGADKIETDQNKGFFERGREYAHDTLEDFKEKPLADQAQDKVNEARDRVAYGLRSGADKVETEPYEKPVSVKAAETEEKVKENVAEGVDKAADNLDKAADETKGILERSKDYIVDTAVSVQNYLSDTAVKAKEAVVGTGEMASEKAKETTDDIRDNVADNMDHAASKIETDQNKGILERTKNYITDTAASVKDYFTPKDKSLTEEAQDGMDDLRNKVADNLKIGSDKIETERNKNVLERGQLRAEEARETVTTDS
jgi:hypothetical protein